MGGKIFFLLVGGGGGGLKEEREDLAGIHATLFLHISTMHLSSTEGLMY